MSKVSVIVVCYNHAEYVADSISSVLHQDYPEIEIIVIDDASTDRSAEVIKDQVKGVPEITFIENDVNLGLCRSFNRGLERSSGDYIIDLAADDQFLPGKISTQVKQFHELPDDYGVVFSDAQLIDINGKSLGTHFEKVDRIGKIKKIPVGDVFKHLLEYFFIAAATQMVKREVFDELGGYDENLEYEDFDFWVRSSRHWKYDCIAEPLMIIRKLEAGMSSNMYGPDDKKVLSTYAVVEKARELIKSEDERKALLNRVAYELRMAYKYKNPEMLDTWYTLYREMGGSSIVYKLLKLIS